MRTEGSRRARWGVAALLLVATITGVALEAPLRLPDRTAGLPAIVHARPLEIRAGQDPSSGIVASLERLGYRRVRGGEVPSGSYRLDRRSLVVGRRASAGRIVARLDASGRIERVRDERGRRLRDARLEPEKLTRLYDERWRDRTPVALAVLPSHLVDAVLEIEDRRFRAHRGLDLPRIAGALIANLRAGRVEQGGSTITQQLAKNLYLSAERSLGRKLAEALLALQLEFGNTKKRILEAYLNEVYLGQRGPVAVHGVGEAARHYFGHGAPELSLGESALLAGLIRSPGTYSPHHRPVAARERRDFVLGVLLERGRISEQDHARAVAEALRLRPAPRWESPAPFAADRVRAELGPAEGIASLADEAGSVSTTLHPELQRLARGAVRRGVERLEQDHPHLRRDVAPL